MSTMDPLTVAYMAIGAKSILDKHPELIERTDDGEKALIQSVIRYAQAADDLATEKTFELEGVFVYEVAEPLGQYIAERLVASDPNIDRAVQHHTAFLVAECCGQSLDEEQEQDR
jgi:hypothetical protein